MGQERYIDTVAYICLEQARILSTLAPGKDTYMIPGGKREGNETDEEVLIREVKEEVAIDLVPGTIKHYNTFEAQAYGHPEGVMVRMACYTAEFIGEPRASSEKEKIAWLSYEDKEKSSPVDKLVFEDLKSKGLLA